MVQFQQSSYRFTEPIRYYKSNDPIYYEVDNIPLKQLQENNMWLKDQLAKLEYQQIFNTSTFNNTTVNSSRAGFDELRPYTNGSDNKVYVRPGRYTARINDVFNLQPLQVISKLTNSEYIDTYNFKTNRDGQLRSILDTFKTQLQANSLGMNGLMERAFTRASRNLEEVSQFLNITDPRYLPIPIANTAELPYPSTIGQVFIYNLAVSSADSATYGDITTGFLNTVWQESNWMKKWRGVARTSIVDIPSQLDIEIPAFNPDDFYYTNESGVRTTLTAATQRIDLLFIYSKPIDASAATIAKFPNNSNVPTKIYAPALGLVKGAGVGLNLDNRNYTPNNPLNAVPLQDENGNQMIVPNISDELGQNLGFSGVKGSFPSPDDLLNLAPTLVESLESDNIALLGQSILPIAYIVVKKNAPTNANGVIVLNSQDVVDIRPFFRTTELAYNERAGIAAAHPQVSIANPVATEAYVNFVARKLKSEFPTSNPVNTGSNLNGVALIGGNTSRFTPRIIGSGYILGGVSWGPEGVLSKYIGSLGSNANIEDKLRSDYFYPQNNPIPSFPAWDLAKWKQELFPNSGLLRNDYLNYILRDFGPNQENWQAQLTYSIDTNDLQYGEFSTLFVTKKIILDMSNPSLSWVRDVKVNLQYFNCIPFGSGNVQNSFGLTYSKHREGNYIVIYIYSFTPNHSNQSFAGADLATNHPRNRRDTADYNNYLVVSHPIFNTSLKSGNNKGYKGPQDGGFCTYPSVSFEIIGIPDYSNISQSLTNTNPILTLS